MAIAAPVAASMGGLEYGLDLRLAKWTAKCRTMAHHPHGGVICLFLVRWSFETLLGYLPRANGSGYFLPLRRDRCNGRPYFIDISMLPAELGRAWDGYIWIRTRLVVRSFCLWRLL